MHLTPSRFLVPVLFPFTAVILGMAVGYQWGTERAEVRPPRAVEKSFVGEADSWVLASTDPQTPIRLAARERRASRLAVFVEAVGRLSATCSWRMDRHWEEMIDGLRTEDMPEAFARVDAIPEDVVRRALRNAILSQWGQIDPHAALAWVDVTEQASDRPWHWGIVISHWTNSKPEASGGSVALPGWH